MKFSFTTISGLVLLATDALASTTWHMDRIFPLGDMRLDPIVSPNAVASHMHQIIGGSGFGAAYNSETYTNSKCTTIQVQADHSNYWVPKLYWINGNGTSFTPLSATPRFYYFIGQNSKAEVNHAFPPGLRMLTGSPDNKQPNWFNVRYQCHVCSPNNAGDLFSPNFNFDNACPCGLTVTIGFNQCWDGINLYKPDQSHMAPLVGGGTTSGNCPWSHPIRVPYIFFEMTYQTGSWAPNQTLKGNLAWANGDTTGYGAHADFVNGWDQDVLQAALNSTVCNDGVSEIPFINCPIFAASNNVNAAASCKNQLGVMSEASGLAPNNLPINSLPGCNPLWGASGPKPTCDSQPPAPNVAPFQGTDGSLVAAKPLAPVMPTTPGWSEVACLMGWGLTNYVTYYDNNVTPQSCQANCLMGGYNYASVGLTSQTKWSCQCASGISPQANVYWGMCTTPCPGDKTQTCGGPNAFSIYYAPPGTVTPTTNTTVVGYKGCYADPPSGAGAESTAFYNFQLQSVTPQSCNAACSARGATWAGTKNGNQCYCGKGNSFPMSNGYWTAESNCYIACAGDSKQKCGGPVWMNVYNLTLSNPPVPINSTNGTTVVGTSPSAGSNSVDLGCFTAGPGSNNVAMTGASFKDSKLTPARCQFGCAQLGFPLAATLQGSTCQCGNTYTGGPNVPETACQLACAGDSTQKCGGSGYAELFNTTTSLANVASTQAAKGTNWLGCYNNQQLKGPSDWQVSGGGLSPQWCISSCASLGYGFAGLQNGNTCTCSKANPTAVLKKQPSNMFCTSACAGNASQTCGGAYNAVEVYTVPNTTVTNTPTTPGYKGCYSGTGGVYSYSMTTSAMTVDLCQQSCKVLNYTLAAVSGTGCTCGNSWGGGGILGTISCNGACPGNSTQMCGASGRTSLYNTAPAAMPAVYNDPQYMGCYVDSSTRMLTTYSISNTAMSVDNCKAVCKAKGANFAGMENGNQCFCGTSSTLINGVLSPVGLLTKYPRAPDYQCGQKCAGNWNQQCGGLNNWRMSLYKLSNVPVSSSASASSSSAASSSSSKSVASSSSAAASTSTKAVVSTSTVPTSKSSPAASASSSDDGQWGEFESMPTAGATSTSATWQAVQTQSTAAAAAKGSTSTSKSGSAQPSSARNVKCKRSRKVKIARE